MSCDDVLRQETPSGNRSLAVLTCDSQRLLVALLRVNVQDDVHDDDRAQETHALLGDGQ